MESYRLTADYLARSFRRKLERERRKENIKKARAAGLELPKGRKALKKEKKEPCDISMVIDSSFDDYMQDDDIKKLVKQIQRCYAINRRAETPFQVD